MGGPSGRPHLLWSTETPIKYGQKALTTEFTEAHGGNRRSLIRTCLAVAAPVFLVCYLPHYAFERRTGGGIKLARHASG